MLESEELPKSFWILRVVAAQNPRQTPLVSTRPLLASLPSVRGGAGGGEQAHRGRAPPGGGRVIVEGGAGGAAGGEGAAEPDAAAAAQEDLRKDDAHSSGARVARGNCSSR